MKKEMILRSDKNLQPTESRYDILIRMMIEMEQNMTKILEQSINENRETYQRLEQNITQYINENRETYQRLEQNMTQSFQRLEQSICQSNQRLEQNFSQIRQDVNNKLGQNMNNFEKFIPNIGEELKEDINNIRQDINRSRQGNNKGKEHKLTEENNSKEIEAHISGEIQDNGEVMETLDKTLYNTAINQMLEETGKFEDQTVVIQRDCRIVVKMHIDMGSKFNKKQDVIYYWGIIFLSTVEEKAHLIQFDYNRTERYTKEIILNLNSIKFENYEKYGENFTENKYKRWIGKEYLGRYTAILTQAKKHGKKLKYVKSNCNKI